MGRALGKLAQPTGKRHHRQPRTRSRSGTKNPYRVGRLASEMESDLRYEILDTIASGEFATVSRARDRDLGREVAVKQIHAQFLADPRQLARYWQEAQLLASLQHANIITIYDVVRPR